MKKKEKEKKNKKYKDPKDFLKSNWKRILIGILCLIIISNVTTYFIDKNNQPEEVNYNEFSELLEDKKVEEVYIDFSRSTFTYKLKDKDDLYVTDNPRKEGFKEGLLTSDVKVLESDNAGAKSNYFLIFQVLIWGFIIFFLVRTMNVGNINIEDKSEEKSNITFADIAGNKEAKSEMKTIVEFIQNKEKYEKIGAKLPKGAIFYGPPGTGKTLLAKAIAGETNSAFYSVNASEFVEKFVGVGAGRIRKLFKTAKKNGPAVIFIDEIDAIGGQRGTDGNSEREQTLNQLLSELDGFELSDDIFVIAATNRLDKLDSALIRPGRFDKHISIPNPTTEERLEILELYAKKINLEDDVDLKKLSKVTINMAGAALESLVNESAIIAVEKGKTKVSDAELEESYLKLVMQGNLKENQQEHRREEEIKLVAWHEAGHAVMSLRHGMNVPITTILSSTTGAGGITFSTHKKEGLFSKKEMQEYVKMLYAGRVCEYLLYNNDESKVTIGASSDIKQASRIIHDYIALYGLNDKLGMFSPTALDERSINPLVIDESIALSKKLYDETLSYLTEHKALIEKVANALIELNTIDESQLKEIVKEYDESTK